MMRRFAFGRYFDNTEPQWDYKVPWIVRIIVRWAITIAGFVVARWFVNDIWYSEDRIFIDRTEDLLLAAAIFVVMRAVLRPILIFLTCPLQVLTLGLFILVINALIFLATEVVAGWFGIGFEIDGFWPAFIGAIVIAVVSFVISRVLRRNPVGPRLT
jgi:putative membrane protein